MQGKKVDLNLIKPTLKEVVDTAHLFPKTEPVREQLTSILLLDNEWYSEFLGYLNLDSEVY